MTPEEIAADFLMRLPGLDDATATRIIATLIRASAVDEREAIARLFDADRTLYPGPEVAALIRARV